MTISGMISGMPIGAGRTIREIVAPTKAGGPISRLVGTVDIDGQGTNHPLEECNPFMLLDSATISENGKPTFGAHPHRGHSVVTLLLQGKVSSWDSYHPKDGKTTIEGPSSYWVDAASGLFHDEVTIVEDPSDPTQHCKLFQLWMSVKEEDRLKPPSVQHDTNLQVEDALDFDGNVIGSIRYFVGGSSSSIRTPHPITVAHVTQNYGSMIQFPIEFDHGGFLVHLNGCARYGGDDNADVTTDTNTVHVLDGSYGVTNYLKIVTPYSDDGTSKNEDKTSYLICTGEKIGECWYKKLTSNGAVVAKSKEEAREIASKVEAYSKEGLSSGNFAPFGVVP